MDMLLAAFIMGLLGSGHCLGMCGGVAGALAFAVPDTRRKSVLVLGYNLGRVTSYGLMGLLVGSLAAAAPTTGLPIARLLAGTVLILTGLYVANIWRLLGRLERVGGYLWRRLKPFSNRLLPVNSLPKALLFGAIWGWLPCGLVYSALVFAAAQNSSLNAAAAMLAFGAGTLPAVLAGGLMAAQIKPLLQRRAVQWALAFGYVAFGLWTIYAALAHAGHSGHDHSKMHEHHHSLENPPGTDQMMEHHHHHHGD